MLSESNKVVISTGNILNVNKKPGQKTHEELFDCLKLTLADPVVNGKTGQICRNNDDLTAKMTEYPRDQIKIGAKIFTNHACPQQLQEAIDALLDVLHVDKLDNLILVYHPVKDGSDSHSNGISDLAASFSTTPKEMGVLSWGDSDGSSLRDLKRLWDTLETYAHDDKITQLGVADLDTDTLIQLYKSSDIKPTIAQINLSACCVVPPSLQEFCATHEIQLLTHSDPEVVCSKNTFSELDSDILNAFTPTWTSRYQVHIRCRGVLTAKGFIVGAVRE